jgi:hypothetical protein
MKSSEEDISACKDVALRSEEGRRRSKNAESAKSLGPGWLKYIRMRTAKGCFGTTRCYITMLETDPLAVKVIYIPSLKMGYLHFQTPIISQLRYFVNNYFPEDDIFFRQEARGV